LKAWIFRNTAKRCNKIPIQIPFACPPAGQDYVRSLTCSRFEHA
jgi:hypothetical protein